MIKCPEGSGVAPKGVLAPPMLRGFGVGFVDLGFSEAEIKETFCIYLFCEELL